MAERWTGRKLSRNNKGNSNLGLSYHNLAPVYRAMALVKVGHRRKMTQKTNQEPARCPWYCSVGHRVDAPSIGSGTLRVKYDSCLRNTKTLTPASRCLFPVSHAEHVITATYRVPPRRAAGGTYGFLLGGYNFRGCCSPRGCDTRRTMSWILVG